jgi:hypothetical protein
MDWTWWLDPYMGTGLALAAGVVWALALAWWLGSGVRLLREGPVRAAVFLPVALAIGLGRADEPALALTLLVLWLSAEVVAPRLRAKSQVEDARPDPTAARAAGTGVLACLAAAWTGPLPDGLAFFFNALGVIALLAALGAASFVALVLWYRRLPSRTWRAATAAALVLALDALGLGPGSLTVWALGLPMALQLVLATSERQRALVRQRLFAAAVWLVALAGLIAFSRFNLHLSETRSTAVIAACRAYQQDHGHFPDELENLVPSYLPRVPHADWTPAGEFCYTAGNGATLSYFAPWPSEVVYSFATGERQVRNHRAHEPSDQGPQRVNPSEEDLVARMRPRPGTAPRGT